MTRQLEFRILGPIEAQRNGKRLGLGSPKQGTLLAGLLVRAN
jgi:hypothetical protein